MPDIVHAVLGFLLGVACCVLSREKPARWSVVATYSWLAKWLLSKRAGRLAFEQKMKQLEEKGLSEWD